MFLKSDYGIHKDVLFAEFGTGDIMFSTARVIGEPNETQLIFRNHYPKPIGSISTEDKGKTSDEIPKPDLVMIFRKAESITAVIHSLIELQKEVFAYEKTIAKVE